MFFPGEVRNRFRIGVLTKSAGLVVGSWRTRSHRGYDVSRCPGKLLDCNACKCGSIWCMHQPPGACCDKHSGIRSFGVEFCLIIFCFVLRFDVFQTVVVMVMGVELYSLAGIAT